MTHRRNATGGLDWCNDAECDLCRGDTHVIGPNPDTICSDCGMALPDEFVFLGIRRCGECELDEMTP